MGDSVVWLGAVALAVAACSSAQPHPTTPVAVVAPPSPAPLKLVVLPAESDAFPGVAKATTESLLHARVDGLGVQASKVSLEVVQLSIECVDASERCYEAVGQSLAANGLLFAHIAVLKHRQLRVTISLFDVDAKAFKAKREKIFGSEQAATAGIADLVAEATRP